MSIKLLGVCLCSLLVLVGCEQFDALMAGVSPPANSAQTEDASARVAAVYINEQAPATAASLRNIYIEPANLANMQVIQPEGGSVDAEWWIDEGENQVLQAAFTQEFAVALSGQSAFNVVYKPAQADMVLHAAVVAVHPNEARGSVARRTHRGGAITVSIVVVNAANEKVMVRLMDTQLADDVWAFNQVNKGDPALNPVFRTWGEAVRDSLLQAQGRPAGRAL